MDRKTTKRLKKIEKEYEALMKVAQTKSNLFNEEDCLKK